MRRVEFSGAQYVDALPGGPFAALQADGFVTHAGLVPLAPVGAILHHRVGLLDGRFCIAGQGHHDGQAWLWNGERWLALGPSYGTSVTAFGPLGVYVSTPQTEHNIKVFDRDGRHVHTITRPVGARGIAAVTGAGRDAGDVNSVDDWYGHGGLAEYTAVGSGLLVGQGFTGGLVIKHDHDRPSLIEPGHVEFTRTSFDGATFAACAWKVLERKAVICWFAPADLPALPRVPAVEDPPDDQPQDDDQPVDDQPVDDEPEDQPVSIPDLFHVVKAVNDAHPHLLQKNDHDSVREFYWRAAWALHQADPRFGMLSKSGGETGHEIEGVGRVAEDAIAYKDATPIVDIIAGANNPPHRASAVWQVVEQRRESNKWVKPPAFPGGQGGGGAGTGGGTGTGSGAGAVAEIKRLQDALAALRGELAAVTDRLGALEAAALRDGAAVALRTEGGHVLCAENGGGGVVNASRRDPGGWETFVLEKR